MIDFDADKLSRRAFGRFTAAASIAALVGSGCREVGSRGTSIRFWNPFAGPDGSTMLNIVRAFNESHDDVQVVMQRAQADAYYNKLFVAGLGGRAPEVFVVHADNIERFVWGKLLAPVDALFMGQGAIPLDDVDANILARAKYGDRYYAMPLDVHPQGVYYNKALFEQAGIARPPTNGDEFFDACRRIKKPDGPGSVWGFEFEWWRINCYALFRQWGGKIVADDHKTVLIDSPEAEAAFTFAASLIFNEKAAPTVNPDAMLRFRQGRTGMFWGGPFLLQDLLKQTDLHFGASVMPQLGPKRATWASSHTLCAARELSDQKHAAALKFIKFLSDNSLDWAAGGQVPVRKSLRESDRFKSMPIQPTFAEQIPYVEYFPSTTYTFEYLTQFDQVCETVLRGTQSPKDALKIAGDNIRATIERFESSANGGVA